MRLLLLPGFPSSHLGLARAAPPTPTGAPRLRQGFGRGQKAKSCGSTSLCRAPHILPVFWGEEEEVWGHHPSSWSSHPGEHDLHPSLGWHYKPRVHGVLSTVTAPSRTPAPLLHGAQPVARRGCHSLLPSSDRKQRAS